jgi:putative membrane protein
VGSATTDGDVVATITAAGRSERNNGPIDASPQPSRWWVPADDGEEPDYRFTLANERTFLAWVRTALGLLAGGVAVRQLVDPFDIENATTALALLSVGCSVVLVVGGYLRWVAVQRAIRRGERLPPARLVPVVGAAFGVIAIIAFVLIAVG